MPPREVAAAEMGYFDDISDEDDDHGGPPGHQDPAAPTVQKGEEAPAADSVQQGPLGGWEHPLVGRNPLSLSRIE